MEILLLVLALIGGEIIASFIKRLIFKTKSPKPLVVKEKPVPTILIIRYPMYEDKEMEAMVISQFQNSFKHSPYFLILQCDSSIDNFVYEYPKNFYCDSMKTINNN